MNPANPGMSFIGLIRRRTRAFWSLRVNSDIRLIVHRTATSLLLCYVGHHDKAYDWAERRKLEIHPKTGAAQLVEIRERVEEIMFPNMLRLKQPKPPKPPLFKHFRDNDLLGYGVPADWLNDVRESR